jgi:hypothetical protein
MQAIRPISPVAHPIPQDPGAPPQRPHIGASSPPEDLPDSELTAKTLRARAVWSDPHDGHLNFASVFIERTSCSNLASQDLQVYSYIGIYSPR